MKLVGFAIISFIGFALLGPLFLIWVLCGVFVIPRGIERTVSEMLFDIVTLGMFSNKATAK